MGAYVYGFFFGHFMDDIYRCKDKESFRYIKDLCFYRKKIGKSDRMLEKTFYICGVESEKRENNKQMTMYYLHITTSMMRMMTATTSFMMMTPRG
mgnify:CR=1 FL=1